MRFKVLVPVYVEVEIELYVDDPHPFETAEGFAIREIDEKITWAREARIARRIASIDTSPIVSVERID